MNAARALRTARRRADMSQRDLAMASGIPQPSIARIERGLSNPRVDTLDRLLNAAHQELFADARLGMGVDRTLIRAMLELTPAQRGSAAANAGRAMISLMRGARFVARDPS